MIGYCKWVTSIYFNLSECYKQKNSEDLASYYKKQVDNLKLIASNHLNEREDILNVELHRNRPKNLNNFLNEIIEKYEKLN